MVPMVNESNAMAEELGKKVTIWTDFQIVCNWFCYVIRGKQWWGVFLADRQLNWSNKIGLHLKSSSTIPSNPARSIVTRSPQRFHWEWKTRSAEWVHFAFLNCYQCLLFCLSQVKFEILLVSPQARGLKEGRTEVKTISFWFILLNIIFCLFGFCLFLCFFVYSKSISFDVTLYEENNEHNENSDRPAL